MYLPKKLSVVIFIVLENFRFLCGHFVALWFQLGQGGEEGGGGTPLYGLYRYSVCAASKGMVF